MEGAGAGVEGRLFQGFPQNEKGQDCGIADEHVVVEEGGAEEDRRAKSVEQADEDGVGGGDAEGLETRAEEGGCTGRDGSHDEGDREEGGEQEVVLEAFADGTPEKLAIVVRGDGWLGLLEIPGLDAGDEWAKDEKRDGSGDGSAGVVVDECAAPGAGEDVVGVAEEALDVERTGVGEGNSREMFAHDVGGPEDRVGDPAREENPTRCAHGRIMSWGLQ